MFRPHIGDCTYEGCNLKGVKIAIKKGWCEYCNHKEKQKKKGNSAKVIKPRKITGELALFETLLEVRGAKSQVSGERLSGFNIMWFSHILSKGAYPSFRLFDKNIVLKTVKEHQMWETQKHKLKELKEWKWVFELEQELKELYYKQK